MKLIDIIDINEAVGVTNAKLAQAAHSAYVAAVAQGNVQMANHYLAQHQKHKALVKKEAAARRSEREAEGFAFRQKQRVAPPSGEHQYVKLDNHPALAGKDVEAGRSHGSLR